MKSSFDAKVAEETEKARQEAIRAANTRMEEKIAAEVGKLKDDIAAERSKVSVLLAENSKFPEESEAINVERVKLLSTIEDLTNEVIRLQDNEVLSGLDGFKKCKAQVAFLLRVLSLEARGEAIDVGDVTRRLGFCWASVSSFPAKFEQLMCLYTWSGFGSLPHSFDSVCLIILAKSFLHWRFISMAFLLYYFCTVCHLYTHAHLCMRDGVGCLTIICL